MSKRKFNRFMRQAKIVVVLAPWLAIIVLILNAKLAKPIVEPAMAAPAPVIQLIEVKDEPKDVSYNVGKYAILDKIAKCESGGNYGLINNTTSAWGKYQIVWATWNLAAKHTGHADKMNPEDQEINARWLIDNRGTRDWEASKGCWNK